MPKNRLRRGPPVKERLLDAATFLFAEKGLGSASVDEIVERAGCNKRMVYHYFGSKEMLYRAVLLGIYRAMEKFEEQLVRDAGGGPPAGFVKQVVTGYLGFLNDHPSFVSLLSWENLNRGRSIRHLPVRVTKNVVLDGLERNFQKQGINLPRRDLEHFFTSLLALCYFTYSNRHTMRQILGYDPAGPGNIERRRDHITALLAGMI